MWARTPTSGFQLGDEAHPLLLLPSSSRRARCARARLGSVVRFLSLLLTKMPSILKMAQPVVVKARKEEPAAKKGALAGVPNVEQLLDLIVPPQTRTTEDGSLWVQRISSTPATRTDTVHVQVRRCAARSSLSSPDGPHPTPRPCRRASISSCRRDRRARRAFAPSARACTMRRWVR